MECFGRCGPFGAKNSRSSELGILHGREIERANYTEKRCYFMDSQSLNRLFWQVIFCTR
jgi:hypothetical protein